MTGQGITSETRNVSDATDRRAGVRELRAELQRAGMDAAGKLQRPALELVDGVQRHFGRFCDRHGLLPAARRARAQRTLGIHVSAGAAGPSSRTGPASTWSASGTTPGLPLDYYFNPSYYVQLSPQHQRLGVRRIWVRTGCGRSTTPRCRATWSGTATRAGVSCLLGARAVPGRERRLQPGHAWSIIRRRGTMVRRR